VTPEVATRTILIVNPSPDVYGADLQMVQSAAALVERGWRVVVALPQSGSLVPRLHEVGAEVVLIRFPVLRKGNARAGSLIKMGLTALAALPRCLRLIRHLEISVLLVNTVTLPWWLLAGRLSRTPTVGHLHEAETEARRIVRRALVAPLLLADAVIVISRAALDSMADAQPRLVDRAHLIYNGVPGPAGASSEPRHGEPVRLAVVGRLSPRKAPDVALETLAALRRDGYDVELELAGTPFAGYEWFEADLRRRAERPDLVGLVRFSGYCSPIWPVLDRADIVLAPSLREPFGNAVVEAQLARRPVVAAASQGHLESISDGETGLLAAPADPEEMAAAVRKLIDDPALAARLAAAGQDSAARRFSVDRYRVEIGDLVDSVAGSPT